jgi:hypothetical protein
MAPSLCAGVLLAAGGIAGCGGDDEESTAGQQPKVAISSGSNTVFIERLAKVLETARTKSDCAEVEAINARSLTRLPCPAPKGLRKSMASFEVIEAVDYGTGGVIDYKSGEVEDGAAILLFVAPDRSWSISRFGIVTEPSTGTSDEESREGYEQAVENYLAAVRDRDCAAYQKVAFIDESREGDVCDAIFPATAKLGGRLKLNPSAKPKYEGGNGTYGFYSIETPTPTLQNSTISVLKVPGKSAKPYVVLDVAPSPTSADRRRLIRQFRQPGGVDQPETSPSRKAN